MAALVKRDAVIAKETAKDNRVKCIVERKKVNKRAVETKNKTNESTYHLPLHFLLFILSNDHSNQHGSLQSIPF
jgi:hypothetical protein